MLMRLPLHWRRRNRSLRVRVESLAGSTARQRDPAMIDAMYQEALLNHYRAPHNRREMPDATASAARRNPTCGDEIRVLVRVENGFVLDASFLGHGCSVAIASASLMTDAICGLRVQDVLEMASALERMLGAPDRTASEAVVLPAPLHPLRGVAAFSGRHSCVRMAWHSLRQALGQPAAMDTPPEFLRNDPVRPGP